MNRSLRPVPAVPAEPYKPIQKHEVIPSIPGWLNYYIRNTLVNDSEDTNPAVPPLFSGAAVEPGPLHVAAPWQKFHHLPETYNRLQGWTRPTRTPAFWEYSPSPHDYPYYWFILDPKSKHDEVKVINFGSLEFCKNIYMRHIFWGCLIRCINMQWIQQLLLRIQSGYNSVHGRADNMKPVYPPFNFVEVGVQLLGIFITFVEEILVMYLSGLVQDCGNTTAKLTHWSYCSLGLSRQNIIWHLFNTRYLSHQSLN